MPEQQKEVIIVPRLEWAVKEIEEYASLKGIYLPYCEFNFTSNGNGTDFSGQRTVYLYHNAPLIITQEGNLPLAKRKFSEFINDFYCYSNDKEETGYIANKIVQKIQGTIKIHSEKIEGIINLYFEGGKSYVEIIPKDYSHEKFKFYEKRGLFWNVDRGKIRSKNIPTEDEGWVLDSPSYNFAREISRKFEAETTKMRLEMGKEKIPLVLCKENISVSDLALYLSLMGNKRLKLLNRIKLLVSVTGVENDLSMVVKKIESDDEKEDSKDSVFLLDGKALLQNEDYQLFASEKCQKAINLLNEFYQQAEKEYGPLLREIEEMVKVKESVAK